MLTSGEVIAGNEESAHHDANDDEVFEEPETEQSPHRK